MSDVMDTNPELVDLSPGPALAIRSRVSQAELPTFFGNAYTELAAAAADNVAGPPLAIYHAFGPDGVDVTAAFPVHVSVPARGRVIAIQLDGGPAVQIKHVGPYTTMVETYSTLEKWLTEHHRTRRGAVREVYLTGPAMLPDAQVTMVVQPIVAVS
jgi:effector-binding domain-containing protein